MWERLIEECEEIGGVAVSLAAPGGCELPVAGL
jgi:hypothetical protein